MSKRLYLLILFAVTLFCGCKNSNPLDSTTKVSFSIPARVLEDVGNNNGEDILVCTQVLRGSKVIIDEKYERTLFFDENNKPCIESIVFENIPLYTSLVFKMQIFVGEELFAEGVTGSTYTAENLDPETEYCFTATGVNFLGETQKSAATEIKAVKKL